MRAEPAARPLEACPYCGADHGEAALRCPATDMVLPFQGRLLAGKFRFIAELGRGGMGAVWLARNIHVDREVAIKLILPEVPRNPEIVARFQDEARVAARVGHAGICDILDFEQTSLGPVIVMELLRGENLGQRIQREGSLPVPVALGIMRQALVALEAAHRAGVIHRDLKPENLFLHQPDAGAMVVKLMDFGISKFIDRAGGLTGNGAILGTPEYMAPEQIGGAAHADARTDIWAIGAVLYKALTGVNAFAGDSVVAILLAVAAEDPAPLESHIASLPRGLSAIVLRCLARRPDDRFQSATELAEALAPFAAPELPAQPLAEREAIGLLPTLALTAVTPTNPGHEPLPVPLPVPLPARPRRGWPWLALGVLGACGLAAWWFTGRADPRDPDAPPAVAITERVPDSSQAVTPPSPAPDPPVTADPIPRLAPPSRAHAPVEVIVAHDGATGTELAATTAEPAATTAEPTPQPAPDLITAGEHVTPAVAGEPGNQHWAKEYCAALARNKYLGIARWKLANPREAKRFTGVAGLRSGGYWTTANYDGVGLVVSLPRGTTSSVRASKTSPRPLCVATRA